MKAIIWDLDNTLYQSPDGFFDVCCAHAAQHAVNGGYAHDAVHALDVVHASFQDHGYALAAFFQDHGLDRERVEPGYVQHVASLLAPCAPTRIYIQDFSGPQMVLSHSNIAWVNAIMTKLDLDELIPPSLRLASETIGHEGKKLSAEPFRMAATLLKHDPTDIMVFEDAADNLVHAKALGMTTILVTNGRDAAFHPHVDYVVTRPHDLKALL